MVLGTLTRMQRRCIHDENGNVDAAKAAEQPVPRGSAPNKKRANGEDGSPMPIKKIKQQDQTPPPPGQAQPRPIEMQQYGTPFGQLKARAPSYHPPPPQQVHQKPSSEPATEQPHPQFSQPPPPPHHTQTQIDPNLFSLYTQDDQDGPYHSTHYPFPGSDQPQPYHQRPQSSGYNIPSLEQIANECLVDMSGPDPPEGGQTALERNLHLFQNADTAHLSNGEDVSPKPVESVDSGISIPATDIAKQDVLTRGHTIPVDQAPQPPIEASDPAAPTTAQHDERPQSSASKSGAHGLPLYQPPAPVSQSPEVSKRQPVLTNGISHGSPSTTAETNGIKRKRDSSVSATSASKKTKMSFAGGAEQAIVEDGDKESVELARMLQQEDRGLRRRS